MTLEQSSFIMYTQTFLFGLGFLLALIQIRKRPRYIQMLCLLFLLSSLSDVAAFILYKFKITPNYAASVNDIISFPVLSLIYYYGMGKKYSNIYCTVCLLFSLFALTNLLFIQKSANNSYSKGLGGVIILVYSIYYFYWLIKELPTTHLQQLPMFWINTAFILYYSGNFLLFVFTDYLVNVLNNNLLLYWTMHNLLGITECVMLIIAVLIDLNNIKKK